MTESDRKKTEYLRSFEKTEKTIKDLEKRIRQIRDSCVNSSEYMNMAREAEEELEKERIKKLIIIKKIIDAIERIDKKNEQEVIRKKYLDIKSNREIAKEMCYSESQIKRIHRMAIRNFKINE
ncbi:MAG: hypothetical protein Q4F24_08000 [Eubacteriales bacterium]|nr:hypothetical protein [Eubacteriales bacterium]